MPPSSFASRKKQLVLFDLLPLETREKNHKFQMLYNINSLEFQWNLTKLTQCAAKMDLFEGITNKTQLCILHVVDGFFFSSVV